MSLQGYYPGKNTRLQIATEIPPTVPATWTSLNDIYEIAEFPLRRAMHDTTTLSSSMHRDHTKGIYDPIEVPFSGWYLQTSFQDLVDIQDEEPGERWWRILLPDAYYFEFMATVKDLVVAPEGLTGAVKYDGVLTISAGYTFDNT